MLLKKPKLRETKNMEPDKKLFVISDTHFYHTNIIKYCDRPFKDAESMNETIISNWNNTVGKDDWIIHLGDIVAGVGKQKNEKVKELDKILNGKKIYIRGNHDNSVECVPMYEELCFDFNPEIKIYISHRPEPNFKRKANFHLYGHIHEKKNFLNNAFNCSVEQLNYTPIEISELIEKHYDITQDQFDLL